MLFRKSNLSVPIMISRQPFHDFTCSQEVDEDDQEYRLGFTTQRLPVKQELLYQAKHHHAGGGQQVNKVFWHHPRI